MTNIPPRVRLQVLVRDGGCVALRLDPRAGVCNGSLELDHVRGKPQIGQLQVTQEGGFGRRPPSDSGHLAVLCRRHHQGGWARSHRDLLRAYLKGIAA